MYQNHLLIILNTMSLVVELDTRSLVVDSPRISVTSRSTKPVILQTIKRGYRQRLVLMTIGFNMLGTKLPSVAPTTRLQQPMARTKRFEAPVFGACI